MNILIFICIYVQGLEVRSSAIQKFSDDAAGGRGLISVGSPGHDDQVYIFTYICVYTCICRLIYIYRHIRMVIYMYIYHCTLIYIYRHIRMVIYMYIYHCT
jgi:hypothetical protein